MKYLLAAVAAIALVASLPAALAAPQSSATEEAKVPRDKYPASCDGHPAKHHVQRAKKIIVHAYGRDARIPDKTPLKRRERAGLQKHKFCIQHKGLRKRISKWRDTWANSYRAKLKSWRIERQLKQSWCSPDPAPDGGGCWEIPTACVMGESGGSWTAHNPTSPARGPYQLLGHGEPWPVNTYKQALAHHRIAENLRAQSGMSPWVHPDC